MTKHQSPPFGLSEGAESRLSMVNEIDTAVHSDIVAANQWWVLLGLLSIQRSCIAWLL